MKFWIPIVIMTLPVGCSVLPKQMPGNTLTTGARPLHRQAWMGIGKYKNWLIPKKWHPPT